MYLKRLALFALGMTVLMLAAPAAAADEGGASPGALRLSAFFSNGERGWDDDYGDDALRGKPTFESERPAYRSPAERIDDLAEDVKGLDKKLKGMKTFDFDIHAKMLAFWYHPRGMSGVADDLPRDNDWGIDFFELTIARKKKYFGMKFVYRFRDEAYPDYGPNWMPEGFIYLHGRGVQLEVGKVRVGFGADSDYGWFGNVLYYKGFMGDTDWGVRFHSTRPEKADKKAVFKFDFSFTYVNRSDGIDGTGRGGVGVPYYGTEIGAAGEREQRDALCGMIGGYYVHKTTRASFGISYYFGGYRAELDATRNHENWFALHADIRTRFFDILGELGTYTRKDNDLESGSMFLLDILARLYINDRLPYFKSIAFGLAYSADMPREEDDPDDPDAGSFPVNDSFMIRPIAVVTFTDNLLLRLEYIDWKYSGGPGIDRGAYFQIEYKF